MARNNKSSYIGFNINAALRGTMLALMISIAGATILGIVFYFLGPSEKYLPLSAQIVLFLSVFSGGIFAAQKAGNRGIYHGLLVSILFFIFSWLLATLFFPGHAVFLNAMQKLIMVSIAGGLGGILGVGFSS